MFFVPAVGWSTVAKALVLISRTAGTNRGNLTSGGGLAAIFDGNTNQGVIAGGYLTAGTPWWVGKTLAAAKIFGQAKVYSPNDIQFTNANGGNQTTINVRGKNGAAPANATDGTIIGTTGAFTDNTANQIKTISSTDLVTTWDHIFIQMTNAGGNQGHVAELELWEWA